MLCRRTLKQYPTHGHSFAAATHTHTGRGCGRIATLAESRRTPQSVGNRVPGFTGEGALGEGDDLVRHGRHRRVDLVELELPRRVRRVQVPLATRTRPHGTTNRAVIVAAADATRLRRCGCPARTGAAPPRGQGKVVCRVSWRGLLMSTGCVQAPSRAAAPRESKRHARGSLEGALREL